MESLFSFQDLISFFVRVVLEIVLGIHQVIFVRIRMNRLPKALQPRARLTWMITGMSSRCIVFFAVSRFPRQKTVCPASALRTPRFETYCKGIRYYGRREHVCPFINGTGLHWYLRTRRL